LADQTSPGANSVLIGLADVMVQAGSHLATYYSSDAGRLRIAGPFLSEGIVLGQPCFLIASGKPLAQYVEFLEQNSKAELAHARHRGLFETAPSPGNTVEAALSF
jgi:predicted deacylase